MGAKKLQCTKVLNIPDKDKPVSEMGKSCCLGPNSPTTSQDLNGTLTDNTSVKWEQVKTFLFNPILLKLGEVVVSMCTTTSPSFNKIGLNTKKFLFVPV